MDEGIIFIDGSGPTYATETVKPCHCVSYFFLKLYYIIFLYFVVNCVQSCIVCGFKLKAACTLMPEAQFPRMPDYQFTKISSLEHRTFTSHVFYISTSVYFDQLCLFLFLSIIYHRLKLPLLL